MASTLPEKLRLPAIIPFASRAAQLEKYRPIVSYWCNYYIVNQILTKGLHTADDECKNFTVTLMDKLEEAKTQEPTNDAIIDDVVAKAYVEQFALETFQRGDDAIHTDKASRQTIDTFQAASTFLELLNIWDPSNQENTAKIKYAKYHALRIAKAIKAGEDPNASNPKDEAHTAAELGLPSPTGSMPPPGTAYRPPTVESAPDSVQPSRPTSIPQSTPLAPPPMDHLSFPPASAHGQPEVSPIDEPTARNSSVGGGYFPSVPTFTSENAAPSTSIADPDISLPDVQTPATGLHDQTMPPPASSTTDIPATPQDFYSQKPSQPPPQYAPPPQVVPSRSQPVRAPAPHPAPAPSGPQPAANGPYRDDDEAVFQAQKHAKWAISALHFEDVSTAVKELRLALQSLGAS